MSANVARDVEVPADKTARSTMRRTLVTTELLDQATQLFAAKGYEATSLQDIADVMGVSRPALYHYLRSKDDILAMLVEQVSQTFADVLSELAARPYVSPTQKLRELTSLLVRQRAEHPDQFRILDRSETVLPEPSGAAHLEAKRRVLREMTNIIDEGVRTGEFVAVDSRTAALSLLGMCNWVAWWFRPGAEVQPVVDTMTEFGERMLSARGDEVPTEPRGLVADIRSRLDRLDRLL
jgi:AcrR family transcriptional regulator